MSVAAPLRETLITCRTPAGVGAIATLAIWGPRAGKRCATWLNRWRKRSLVSPQMQKWAVYGWGDSEHKPRITSS